MPGELAVQAIAHSQTAADAVGQVGAVAAAGSAANPAAQAASTPKTESASSTDQTPPSLYANPVSELDPALGIVVLHFYNAQGEQTSSIPSQKQLDSYRLHDQTGGASPTAASAAPTSAHGATGDGAAAVAAAAAAASGAATAAPAAARPAPRAAPADTPGTASSASQADTGGAPLHIDETGD